ncbi:MAG: phosphatase PAP2 family protein [Acidobacteriia bacterium]|nr:phosphatase PAP2 family protein [Terriglobia bacterium]
MRSGTLASRRGQLRARLEPELHLCRLRQPFQDCPRVGALFLFLAASITVATVCGRYHYAVDAVAGALVGVAAYCASNAIKRRAID